MKNALFFIFLLLQFPSKITAQEPSEKIVNYRWKANWIAPQNINLKEF